MLPSDVVAVEAVHQAEERGAGEEGADELGADVDRRWRHGMRPPSAAPTVTAGLKWPPETRPKAYAMTTTVRPKARPVAT